MKILESKNAHHFRSLRQVASAGEYVGIGPRPGTVPSRYRSYSEYASIVGVLRVCYLFTTNQWELDHQRFQVDVVKMVNGSPLQNTETV